MDSQGKYGKMLKADLIRQIESLEAQVSEFRNAALADTETDDSVKLSLLLLNMHNELALARSFDDLCQRAVELARSQLGFSRIGMWLVDPDDVSIMRGSFGTDENGNTRDERGLWYKVDLTSHHLTAWKKLREDDTPARPQGILHRATLTNHLAESVGEGFLCYAPVWEGRRVLGFISGDNYGLEREFTQADLDRLTLYGSMLGTLLAHKQAEQRQQEDNERYASIFQNAALGIIQYNFLADLLEINPAAARMFGFDSVEAAVRQFRDIAPRLYAGPIPLDELHRRLSEGTGVEQVEAELYRQDRTSWTANLYLRSIRNQAGQIERVEGFIEDITARKEAERNSFVEMGMALLRAHDELAQAKTFDDLCRKAVELARTHLGVSRAGMWLCDKNAPTIMCGMFGTDEHGNTRDERGATYRIGEGDVYADWQTRLQQEPSVRPEGSLLLRPLRNHLSEVVGYGLSMVASVWEGRHLLGAISADNLNLQRNLTQADLDRLMLYASMIGALIARKQAEAQQQEANERYAAIFQNSVLGIFQCSPSGQLIEINPAVARMFGFESIEDACQTVQNIARNYVGPTPLRELLRRVYANPATERVEAELKRKDGSIWTANLYLRAVRDVQGKLDRIEGFVEDITERKRAAEERFTLERQIQHSQKLESLGVLASGIAHDFNNILMAILGYADLAISDLSDAHPAHFSVHEIKQGAIRAAELTRQMLAYSGKGHFIINSMDVSTLINDMVDLLRTSISRSITLNVQLEQDLPLIKADSGQIQQIVLNLITNASEAIGDQPGVIAISTGRISCTAEYFSKNLATLSYDAPLPPGTYIYFEIKDTGCGMDDATKARVFDPFFTTKFTGRGLGMAAVLGIVSGHKGAITLDTKPGAGSTFRVLFPAAHDESPPVAAPDTTQAHDVHAPQELQHGTILVVDDEATVRKLTSTVLTRQGFTVLTADDGIQGVNVFRKHAGDICCVLLDLTMPNMGGSACFSEMRQIKTGIKVILSSGYSEEVVTTQFSDKEIAGFIQKPYQPHKLLAKIAEVLNSGDIHDKFLSRGQRRSSASP